jgi:7-cyano-7-deazaguanine synthase
MARGAVVLLSGGMDSTTLAYHTRALIGDEPLIFASFNYGQRHKKELEYARVTARALNGEHVLVDLSGINPLLQGSALTSADVPVPEGHYAAPSMKLTVVPNRNMIMLSIAAGLAVSRGLGLIGCAVHAGDHAVYPDCRPEFIAQLNEAIRIGNEGFGEPELVAPFVYQTKADIARRGAELGVPWGDTWSCYKGSLIHCGKCGTCVERREAFQLAGITDPTEYEGSLVT